MKNKFIFLALTTAAITPSMSLCMNEGTHDVVKKATRRKKKKKAVRPQAANNPPSDEPAQAHSEQSSVTEKKECTELMQQHAALAKKFHAADQAYRKVLSAIMQKRDEEAEVRARLNTLSKEAVELRTKLWALAKERDDAEDCFGKIDLAIQSNQNNQ